jgi:RNA polymerase subunit RPABC4/transcription elongation factor Spt4
MEWLARGTQVLIALGGAYLMAFWFVLAIWTFRDIETRSRNVVAQIFATLMVVLFFVPGVLLYLILRPKETLDEAFQRSLEEEYLLQDLEELPLCPSCHHYVNDDFILCPHCHVQLREPCAACSRLVDLRWALCAYCGTVQHGRAEATEPVAVPEARWTNPRIRRTRAENVTGVPASTSTEPALIARSSKPAVETAPALASPTPPFSMAAGMKSIVRPFDRFRLRDPESGEVIAELEREANPSVSNVSPIPTNGASHDKEYGAGHPMYPRGSSDTDYQIEKNDTQISQGNGRVSHLRDESLSRTERDIAPGASHDGVTTQASEDGKHAAPLAGTGADRSKRLV